MKFEGCLEETVQLPVEVTVNGEAVKQIVIREVVGFDEEAISQPKFKDNIITMLHEIIWRCITEIPGTDKLPTRQDVKNFPVFVLDYLTLCIRRITLGNTLEQTMKCDSPSCGKEMDTVWDISTIETKGNTNEHKVIELERGIRVGDGVIKSVTIQPITGVVQEKFSTVRDLARFGELSTDMIYSLIVDGEGTKITKEHVSSMVKKDRKAVLAAIKEFYTLDLSVEVECRSCGHIFQSALNIIDFLA